MATDASYDVFLSHATPDKPAVEELARRLKRRKLKPFLDKWHLVPGEPWQEALEEALDKSKTVAVLLGPSGLGPWQNEEVREALATRVADKRRRVIPVLLPGASMPDQKALPRFLTRLTWVDFRRGLDDIQAFRQLISGITGTPPGGNVSRLPPSTQMIGIPHRNPYFTGREELLFRLHQRLQTQGNSALAQAALFGLGGIGKTQIAIEYGYRFRESYRFVLWVMADEETAIRAAYRSIARELDLVEEKADLESAVQAVKDWLSREVRWLLIFDNADAPALVRPYLPSARLEGKVLLTSRARRFVKVGIKEPFRVPTLESEGAVKFLIERTGSANAQAAAALARELDYLPLALEQAAAYIETVEVSFDEYLARYRQLGLSMLERGKPTTDYPKTVANTWTLSFEAVRQSSPASAELLDAAALLAPDSIPIEIFTQGADELGKTPTPQRQKGLLRLVLGRLSQRERQPVVGDALSKALVASRQGNLSFWELLAPLEHFSLVERLPDDAFKLHRLTQEVIKERLGYEGRRVWAERVVRALNAAYPPARFENWKACERLQANASLAYKLANTYNLEFAETGQLFNEAGSFLSSRGDHATAKSFFEFSLRTWARVLGPEYPETLSARNNLAVTLQFLDDLAGAGKLFKQIMDIQGRVLGADHPITLEARQNLAMNLRALGDLAAARKHLEQTLETKERMLGREHPETIRTAWNLLLTLRDLNDSVAAGQILSKLCWLLDRPENSLVSPELRAIRQWLHHLLNSA